MKRNNNKKNFTSRRDFSKNTLVISFIFFCTPLFIKKLNKRKNSTNTSAKTLERNGWMLLKNDIDS